MPYHVGNYGLVVDLPPAAHQKADLVLASILTLSPLWAVTIGDVNQWLAFVGGIIGVTIGLIRLFRMTFNNKKKNGDDDGMEGRF